MPGLKKEKEKHLEDLNLLSGLFSNILQEERLISMLLSAILSVRENNVAHIKAEQHSPFQHRLVSDSFSEASGLPGKEKHVILSQYGQVAAYEDANVSNK